MSQPLDNIKQAIDEHGQPHEERRTIPNWFTLVYAEDYRDGRPEITNIDPAASTQDRPSPKGKPKKNI